jgi:hypothetical protein
MIILVATYYGVTLKFNCTDTRFCRLPDHNGIENPGTRGRILGRNPDKIPKSFHPCCSQSLEQLCI